MRKLHSHNTEVARDPSTHLAGASTLLMITTDHSFTNYLGKWFFLFLDHPITCRVVKNDLLSLLKSGYM